MRYLEFKNNLGKFDTFTKEDIYKFEPSFDLNALTRWSKKGYIKKILKGHYIFADRLVDEKMQYIIANKICKPSYISLYSALRHYNLIPEEVAEITSITTSRTARFQTPFGFFRYKSMKKELFFGMNIINKYMLAEPEKAVLDFLYFSPQYKQVEDFHGLRVNASIFLEIMDLTKLKKYSLAFENASLMVRLENLLKFVNDYA